MVGKSGERRFRAEIRLGDSGVRVWPRLFRGNLSSPVASQSPKRNFDWGVPLGVKRIRWAKVENFGFGRKSACKILLSVCVCPAFSPKRDFVWEAPLGIKRIWLAKLENVDFGLKSFAKFDLVVIKGHFLENKTLAML